MKLKAILTNIFFLILKLLELENEKFSKQFVALKLSMKVIYLYYTIPL